MKGRRFLAKLIGLVLLASGLLKLIDPVGTGLIVAEYFKFFHVAFLLGISKGFGVALCLLETITGAALITGAYRKLAAIVSTALIGVFTIITLILLIANPEMDCGCFGQAIHLTHLQSFLKNVVLLAIALAAFIPFRNPGETPKHKTVVFWVGTATIVLAMVYSLTHLPVMDFTDFKPGSVIMAARRALRPAQDSFHAAYIYEKDGVQESFTLDRLPDTTWTFVKVDTVYRNRPEIKAPVLSIRDSDGNYRDSDAALGQVMVFSVYNPETCNWEQLEANTAKVPEGVACIVLATEETHGAMVSDYRTLIALNRANGGITYLSEGEVIRKWQPRDYPSTEALDRLLQADATEARVKSVTPGRIMAEGYALVLLAILIIL